MADSAKVWDFPIKICSHLVVQQPLRDPQKAPRAIIWSSLVKEEVYGGFVAVASLFLGE